jgi:nudix motif 8
MIRNIIATPFPIIKRFVGTCPSVIHHELRDRLSKQELHQMKIDNFPVSEIPVLDETAGVFRANETDDIKVLVNNFTAPALALALRTRESTLQQAAVLAKNGEYEKLRKLLDPFLLENVVKRRIRNHEIDFQQPLSKKDLLVIQRYMHRLPRQLYQPAASRASVLIPLCNHGGVPSILFERRSEKVKFKHQVCFPGGMLDETSDSTITQTSLRETEEELGLPVDRVEVLGVLRCHWNEVAHVTGIAVTPVVGFIGEMQELKLVPNSDEVEEYFTIPIETILDDKKWVHKKNATPIFSDGGHTIWGLTAYLLEHFVQDVLLKCSPRE